jgi:hypothetical protein
VGRKKKKKKKKKKKIKKKKKKKKKNLDLLPGTMSGQAAICHAYAINNAGLSFQAGEKKRFTSSKPPVSHEPGGVVFCLNGREASGDPLKTSLFQDLRGCPEDLRDGFSVIGVNTERMDVISSAPFDSQNKVVQVFGTTEVRLSKINTEAFAVGEEVYVRYPTEQDVQTLIHVNEPLGLIVCKKRTLGTETLLQALRRSSEPAEKEGGEMGGALAEKDELKRQLDELRQYTEEVFFPRKGQSQTTMDTLITKFQDIVDKDWRFIRTSTVATEALEIVMGFRGWSGYQKLGTVIKANARNSKKLVVQVDP